MTDLKQQTVRRILTEGKFDMHRYGNVDELVIPKCGTACCIAGNIIAAAADLGLPIPDGYGFISKVHLDNCRTSRASAVARELWAQYYGSEEAERLQFEEDGWGWHLNDVTPEEAVAHVLGGDPNPHGNLPDDDELSRFRL